MPTIDEPVRNKGASSNDRPERIPALRRPQNDWPNFAPVADLQLEPWQYSGAYDPDRSGLKPLPTRQNAGKTLRTKVPRATHGDWNPPPNRPDPIAILTRSNEGRQKEFVPIRMGRMAASPFAFLRGSCAVMACDLAHTPVTGLTVIMNGDAHIGNFGFYGTPQRDVVFDLNDFDEGHVGPWEWDLKRLAASVNVAARQNGMDRSERREAVMKAACGYRLNARRLQSLGVLESWYLLTFPARENPVYDFDPKTASVVAKAVAKAKRTSNARLMTRACEQQASGSWEFIEDPPIVTRVDEDTRRKVINSLAEYCESLPVERRYMLKRYQPVDVVHRIVGVGSVGTRAYLVLMFGGSELDPLFLQIKEAWPAAHSSYLPPLPEILHHEGRRIVTAQRTLQSSLDVLLGTTTIDGRAFYVRQMKNMKGAIPIEELAGVAFNDYALGCGAILARAHARTGDAAKIVSYCGKSETFDSALGDFAEAYGDQTERDHEALVTAIKRGRIDAVEGV